jgi:putative endonuclease
MQYVYILESLKRERYYIGYTCDLKRRLKEHNKGETKGNRSFKPFKIVYIERYVEKISAMRRERYIKSQKSKRFIEELINKKMF